METKYKFYAHIKRAKENGTYLSDVLVKTIHAWRNEREPVAFPGEEVVESFIQTDGSGF